MKIEDIETKYHEVYDELLINKRSPYEEWYVIPINLGVVRLFNHTKFNNDVPWDWSYEMIKITNKMDETININSCDIASGSSLIIELPKYIIDYLKVSKLVNLGYLVLGGPDD